MLSADSYHWMVPTLPVKVMVVDVPEQMVAMEGDTVPPTAAGFTVTDVLAVAEQPAGLVMVTE
jgi:hypothetical protein